MRHRLSFVLVVNWVGIAVTPLLVLVMPANELVHLGREDPIARVLHLMIEEFTLLNVDKVDHSMPLLEAPAPGVNPEFGRYIAVACQGCHGHDVASPVPGPPDAPLPSNLTLLGEWSRDDFMLAVREGIRPTGDTLAAYMPRWISPTNEELFAAWSYLQTLEPQGEHPAQ